MRHYLFTVTYIALFAKLAVSINLKLALLTQLEELYVF